MALTLALPLSGLDPENFSTLSAKLLKLAHERNLPTVERDSPSTASDSSGISSCITSNTSSVEITPNSSRPITPIRLINPKKSEENINNMNTEDNKINQKKEQKQVNIANSMIDTKHDMKRDYKKVTLNIKIFEEPIR